MNRPAYYSKAPHPDEVRNALTDKTKLTPEEWREMPGIIARMRAAGLIQFPNSVRAAEMMHRRKSE